MFGYKAPTVCEAWLQLVKGNDQYLGSNGAWVNGQHELIPAANRRALKNIKQNARKTTLHVGGDTLDIPKDNLVLLRDHPEGRLKFRIITNLNYLSLY